MDIRSDSPFDPCKRAGDEWIDGNEGWMDGPKGRGIRRRLLVQLKVEIVKRERERERERERGGRDRKPEDQEVPDNWKRAILA